MIPYHLLGCPQLSPAAMLVLAYLCNLLDLDDEAFPSIKKMASRCGLCKSQVQRALAKLKAMGVVASTNGKRRSSTYTVNWDAYDLAMGLDQQAALQADLQARGLEIRDGAVQVQPAVLKAFSSLVQKPQAKDAPPPRNQGESDADWLERVSKDDPDLRKLLRNRIKAGGGSAMELAAKLARELEDGKI
jgi:DNA-binding transcriptional MocR family regulator